VGFGQLGLDAWSTPIRIFLATVEVGLVASHEGLDMFETVMRKALVPKQELLLRAG
jgi:phenylalanine-4-hydroxylase